MSKKRRARVGALPPIEPEAAVASVEGLEGERLPLGALWRDRPVVLVFLRHFG